MGGEGSARSEPRTFTSIPLQPMRHGDIQTPPEDPGETSGASFLPSASAAGADDVSPTSIGHAVQTTKSAEKVTWLSLPHRDQLLILALCRLSEPLSNTCLLPYLYYLMRSLQPPDSTPAQISREAGFVVALFALAQFATSMLWAHIADRWGRKPAITIGLTATVISNLGFGFARSIPALMFWRTIAGIGNGNIGVMRTMTAEIVKEKKYQSRAFLLLPLVFNLGTIIGLALGGCLADPVPNIPSLFGPSGLMNVSHHPDGVAWMLKYPFALPTIFNAWALACSLLLAICGLKETMAGKEERKDYGLMLGNSIIRLFKRLFSKTSSSEYAPVPTDEQDSTEKALLHPPPPLPTKKPPFPRTFRTIYNPTVVSTLISFFLLPLHNATFMQVFPLFLSTPPSASTTPQGFIHFNGGLGLPSSTVGLYLSSFGILGILVQLLIYPSLQARVGTLNAFRLALSMFPFAYIVAPYLALLPAYNHTNIIRWSGICLILFVQVTARTFAIPSSVILLTNAAPHPSVLGTVHGAGNMLQALARAVGPALGGWVFAWGMERGVVGTVWWGFLTVVAGAGIFWSLKMRENEGREREKGKGS